MAGAAFPAGIEQTEGEQISIVPEPLWTVLEINIQPCRSFGDKEGVRDVVVIVFGSKYASQVLLHNMSPMDEGRDNL
jgi:hypothetical protein